MTLPTDPAARKAAPVFSGVYAYFPDALLLATKAAWSKSGPLKSDIHERLLILPGANARDRLRIQAEIASASLTLLQLELGGELSDDEDDGPHRFLEDHKCALVAIAECSRAGNDQHNPGQPLHWDRSKSSDEADALVRHLLEAGSFDTDGIRHTTKVAWRALALLQKEIELEREKNKFTATITFKGKAIGLNEFVGTFDDFDMKPPQVKLKYDLKNTTSYPDQLTDADDRTDREDSAPVAASNTENTPIRKTDQHPFIHPSGSEKVKPADDSEFANDERPDYVPEGVPWEWATLGTGERVGIWFRRHYLGDEVKIHIPGECKWWWNPTVDRSFSAGHLDKRLTPALADQCRAFWERHR